MEVCNAGFFGVASPPNTLMLMNLHALRRTFALCLISLFPLALMAQEQETSRSAKTKPQHTFALWGHIRDSFTKSVIKGVKITLMNADSVVLDSCVAPVYNENRSNADCNYRFVRPAVTGRFIIRASHPDYEDCFVNFRVGSIGRNRFFDAPWHYMKRRTRVTADYDMTLDGVTVRATRVKVAYKGDTIVYDASAFKLPDGSMLDALIRQMPGVELNSDGVIKVNGRVVDYLMFNGKDFFKGKNKIMLENLPYFTVSNVQVYERQTDKSRYMGKNIEQKDYVMDVNLKREYRNGFLGNAEAGAATSDNYLARAFGSTFSDHLRVSAFFNVNNINESRTPGQQGDWGASNSPEGRQTSRQAGLNINSDGKDKWYDNNLMIVANWNDKYTSTGSERQSFLATASPFSVSDNRNDLRQRSISLNNTFRLKLPIWVKSETSFQLSDQRQRNLSRSAVMDRPYYDFGHDIETLDSVFTFGPSLTAADGIINRYKSVTFGRSRTLNLSQSFEYNAKLPWGDNVEFALKGDYIKELGRNHQDSRLDYLTAPTDYRRVYQRAPRTYYSYYGRAEYYVNIRNWTMRFYSLYEQSNDNNGSDYYRLNRLPGWQAGGYPLTALPQADSLLLAFSADDSRHQNLQQHKWNSGFNIYLEKNTDSTYLWLRFHLPMVRMGETVHYRKAAVDTVARRSKFYLNGNINFQYQWNHKKQQLSANLWHETRLPNIINYVNFDYTNPLSVVLASSKLHNIEVWRTYVQYNHSFANRKWYFTANHTFEHYHNPIITGYRYDRETGGYVYQSRNGMNEWANNFYAQITGTLGRWTVMVGCPVSLENGQSVEMVDNEAGAELLRIHVFNYSPRMSVAYQQGDFYAGLQFYTSFTDLRYQHEARQGYKLNWFNPSLTARYVVPGIRVQLGSTFSWARSGSTLDGARSLNRYEWNATASRAFMKDKKLLVKLSAFDILNTTSQYMYGGSTEALESNRVLRLGRYVMASVQYNFFANPKYGAGK